MIYDILIIGKSLAGSTLALSLLQRLPTKKIAIIDKNADSLNIKDNRATALSLSSVKIFQQLGLWENDLSPNASTIYKICLGATQHTPDAVALETSDAPLGYNLPNRTLRECLQDKLSGAPSNIHDVTGFEMASITSLTSHIEVTSTTGDRLMGRLLIAADGRASKARELLTKTKTIDYHQTAFTGVVSHTLPHNNTAYELFLPQGPLAFIPLPDPHQSTLVWSLKTPLADGNIPIDSVLTGIMQPYLGDITTAPLQGYPLLAKVATPRSGHRWVLVGDAANALHPVAGQGLNLALRDIWHLTQHLSGQDALGLDLGSQQHLMLYARQRQKDRYSLVGITHLAGQWLNTPHKSIAGLLHHGFRLLDHIPLAKRLIIKGGQSGI